MYTENTFASATGAYPARTPMKEFTALPEPLAGFVGRFAARNEKERKMKGE